MKRIPEDDPNAKFLAIAMKETERMSRILRQMLGFYRPAADLMPTDLNALIEEAEILVAKGGLITVTTESHQDAALGSLRAGAVRVQVADTGPGISEEYLPHLFEPFFSTKGEKGTGLGLWVSLGIAQSHGGRRRCATGPAVARSSA